MLNRDGPPLVGAPGFPVSAPSLKQPFDRQWPRTASTENLTLTPEGRRTEMGPKRNVTLKVFVTSPTPKCEHTSLNTLNTEPYGHFAGDTAIRAAFRTGSVNGTECLAWRHSPRSVHTGSGLYCARRLDACSQQAGELQHPPYSKISRRIGHNRAISVDSPSHVHVSTAWRRGAGMDVQPSHRVGHVVSSGNCPAPEVNARRALDARETFWVCSLHPPEQTLFALAVLKTSLTVVLNRTKTSFTAARAYYRQTVHRKSVPALV
jgi:hypothetical protein